MRSLILRKPSLLYPIYPIPVCLKVLGAYGKLSEQTITWRVNSQKGELPIFKDILNDVNLKKKIVQEYFNDLICISINEMLSFHLGQKFVFFEGIKGVFSLFFFWKGVNLISLCIILLGGGVYFSPNQPTGPIWSGSLNVRTYVSQTWIFF